MRPLALTPGRGIGPFELGALLWDVLTTLRSSRDDFPNVDISWNSERAATGPLLLSVTTPPLRLIFSGSSQRLALVEVYTPTANPGTSSSFEQLQTNAADWVTYRGQTLSTPSGRRETIVNASVLHRIFGPTYPPTPHKTYMDETVLSYPGVAFSLSSNGLARVILTPVGKDGDPPEDQAYWNDSDPSVGEGADGDIKEAIIDLKNSTTNESTSVTFKMLATQGSEPIPISDVKVVIGQTVAEDLLADFGTPLRTFWKEDDRLKIHSNLVQTSELMDTEPNAYFMSYFNLGVDFLLHPLTHQVIKIILHSNIPGEILFGRYSRCPWRFRDGQLSIGYKASTILSIVTGSKANQHLTASPSLAPSSSPSPSPPPSRKHKKVGAPQQSQPGHALPASSGGGSGGRVVASVADEAAMVLDRTADAAVEDGLTLHKPTRLIGRAQLVVEASEGDDVETIWLF